VHELPFLAAAFAQKSCEDLCYQQIMNLLRPQLAFPSTVKNGALTPTLTNFSPRMEISQAKITAR
jgi:hypothetical protein